MAQDRTEDQVKRPGPSGRLKSKEGADSPVNLFDLAMVHRALRMLYSNGRNQT